MQNAKDAAEPTPDMSLLKLDVANMVTSRAPSDQDSDSILMDMIERRAGSFSVELEDVACNLKKITCGSYDGGVNCWKSKIPEGSNLKAVLSLANKELLKGEANALKVAIDAAVKARACKERVSGGLLQV